jgi:hypothetical protein
LITISVISGGQEMKFFWDNDQLTIEHGEIDENCEIANEDRNWTIFIMCLRKPEKVDIYLISSLSSYLYLLLSFFISQLVSKC